MLHKANCIFRAALASVALCLFGPSFAADEIHWTITGPTSVSFDWRGSPTESDIAYGLTSGNYTATVTAENPTGTCVPFSSDGPFWEARLTGLSPDTLYHYSIANGPDHTFRTPPAPGTSNFNILVEADIGDGASYPNVLAVQQQMAEEAGARFALIPGDLSYSDDHGQSVVDQHFNDVMVWSQDVAYMPAWGNHEWDSEPADDLRNYKGRFDFPNPQTSVGTPPTSDCGEDWYWFDYGNARFIAYPEPWTGAWADWKAKATLLMNEAQEDPSISWIVTYGHRPAYSSGSHPGNTTLQDYLGELAATHGKYVLNLNGHSHNYERTYPQNGSGDNLHGAVHVTVGTGGATLETEGPCLWLTCTQPSWSAVRYFHTGYLKLSFTPASIQGAFVCGPAGSGENDITCTPGSVIDSFNIVSSGPFPTIYVDQADPNCSATGPGTAAEPLCTITQGVNRAVAGNTVIVKAGTYLEYVKVTKSGTSTQPIVIRAEPGANVVVSGQFRGFELLNRSWVTIQGFTVSDTSSYGIYVSGSSHIVIADNHVTRAGQPLASLTRYGIELANTTDSVVSGNTTDHNTDAGIALIGGTTGVTVENNVSFANARGHTRAAPGIDVRSGGNTLLGNVVHDNEDSGIQIFSSGGNPSPNNLLVNNLCYDNGDHGIDVSSAGGQRIIGNDVYRNATSGINVEGPSGGTTLSNNISVDNAIGSTGTKGNIRVDPASVAGTTLDYDLVYMSAPGPTIVWNSVNYNTLAAFTAATGREAHGREAAPQWIAPAAGNFHLAAGSPAIDAADSGAVGASDTDIEGRPRVDNPLVADTGAGPRTYDDIGAYEHPLCGNDIKEGGEACDGTDTGVAVCGELGCSGGDPSCTAQCTLDYSTCTGCPVCGNGIQEAGEDCDGGDLGGSSCESLGQCSIGGGLACNAACRFDTAGCSCGNGSVDGGCGEVCDGADLAGQTCISLGLGGGTLGCRTNCTGFVTADCSICGDGMRQGVEACDGADLGGATCSSHGCFAGTPTCTGSCGLDYASCSNCWGGTLYVEKANAACSDAGQGTAAAPFCTINGAAVRVVAGGTVIVSSGTYSEYVKVLSSGTPASPIVFKAAPGATVIVSGQLRGIELIGRSWVTIEGFNVSSTVQNGIYVKSCANVTIRNNHVSHAGVSTTGNTFAGISVSETTDSLISGNTTEDNSDSGIYLNSNVSNVTVEGNVSARNARVYIRAASGIEVRSPGNIIRGNVCHDNEDSGIAVKPFAAGVPAPDNLIVNNVTYGNTVHGIAVSASQSQRIVGNTVYANGESGIDLSTTSSQSLIANNISVDNATSGGGTVGNIRVDSGSTTGTTLDYDLVYRSQPGTMISWAGTSYASLAAFASATGKESHGLEGAPMWVSPADADFRLTIGSPAIDSADSGASGAQGSDFSGGARIDEPVTLDTGVGPRSFDDRGAYEYPLDADNDGFVSDEDCDDMNAAVNPASPDTNCDGVDDNCSGQADEGFASTSTSCGIGACASSGQTSCVNHVFTDTCTPGPPGNEVGCDGIDNDCTPATPDVLDADADTTTCTVDCDDSDPSVYPGALEINDGQDNQCPGGAGYGLIDETSGDSGFHTPGSQSEYSWPAQNGATGYEVARATSPDFGAGCQTVQTATAGWTDSEVPANGTVSFLPESSQDALHRQLGRALVGRAENGGLLHALITLRRLDRSQAPAHRSDLVVIEDDRFALGQPPLLIRRDPLLGHDQGVDHPDVPVVQHLVADGIDQGEDEHRHQRQDPQELALRRVAPYRSGQALRDRTEDHQQAHEPQNAPFSEERQVVAVQFLPVGPFGDDHGVLESRGPDPDAQRIVNERAEPGGPKTSAAALAAGKPVQIVVQVGRLPDPDGEEEGDHDADRGQPDTRARSQKAPVPDEDRDRAGKVGDQTAERLGREHTRENQPQAHRFDRTPCLGEREVHGEGDGSEIRGGSVVVRKRALGASGEIRGELPNQRDRVNGRPQEPESGEDPHLPFIANDAAEDDEERVEVQLLHQREEVQPHVCAVDHRNQAGDQNDEPGKGESDLQGAVDEEVDDEDAHECSVDEIEDRRVAGERRHLNREDQRDRKEVRVLEDAHEVEVVNHGRDSNIDMTTEANARAFGSRSCSRSLPSSWIATFLPARTSPLRIPLTSSSSASDLSRMRRSTPRRSSSRLCRTPRDRSRCSTVDGRALTITTTSGTGRRGPAPPVTDDSPSTLAPKPTDQSAWKIPSSNM